MKTFRFLDFPVYQESKKFHKSVVDITKTFEKKIKALSLHKSQFEDFKDIKERITKRARAWGKAKGYKFAENFTRIILP